MWSASREGQAEATTVAGPHLQTVPLPVLPLLLRSPMDPPLVVITVGQTAPAGSPKRLTALVSVNRSRDRIVWRRHGRVLHLAS